MAVGIPKPTNTSTSNACERSQRLGRFSGSPDLPAPNGKALYAEGQLDRSQTVKFTLHHPKYNVALLSMMHIAVDPRESL